MVSESMTGRCFSVIHLCPGLTSSSNPSTGPDQPVHIEYHNLKGLWEASDGSAVNAMVSLCEEWDSADRHLLVHPALTPQELHTLNTFDEIAYKELYRYCGHWSGEHVVRVAEGVKRWYAGGGNWWDGLCLAVYEVSQSDQRMIV